MENTYNYIYENVKRIQDEISETCIKYNRNPADVILMGVSKTQPAEKLVAAKNAGIVLFGENKVQEMQQKSDFFKNYNVPCHMIGTLQTNKVKYLPRLTDTIQSVNSIKLANEIEKQYGKAGKTANILLEVNIGMEDSKSGISYGQATEMIYQLSEFKNLKVKGLMCIPPIDDEEAVRKYFALMKRLFEDTKAANINNVDMSVLSMGMSGDYKQAIAEGSTLVRVGTAIFGQRNYNL